jgi:hypothetical protein
MITFRHTRGPIIASAAIIQAWCLALAAVSGMTAFGVIAGEMAETAARWVILYLGLATIAVSLVVAFLGRLRRRSS